MVLIHALELLIFARLVHDVAQDSCLIIDILIVRHLDVLPMPCHYPVCVQIICCKALQIVIKAGWKGRVRTAECTRRVLPDPKPSSMVVGNRPFLPLSLGVLQRLRSSTDHIEPDEGSERQLVNNVVYYVRQNLDTLVTALQVHLFLLPVAVRE